MTTYEFELAFSLMSSHRQLVNPNVILSILGITIGVMVLILTLAIYDGYVKKMETIIFSFYPQLTVKNTQGLISDDEDEDFEFISLFGEEDDERLRCKQICSGDLILSDNSSLQEEAILKTAYPFALENLNRIKQKLQTVPGISTALPVIFEDAMFRVDKTDHRLRVLGITHQNNKHYVPQVERIVESELLNQLNNTAKPTILLAAELYKKLYGEDLITPRKLWLQRTDNAQGLEVEVVGVFRLGIHKVADNMIIASFDTAQRLLGMNGYASMLGISLEKPFAAEQTAKFVEKQLDGEKVIVFQWLQVASELFNSLSLYRKLIIVILAMSILITAFNIYNNLAILILERKRQVGILMAMGVKKNSIYKIFLIISQIQGILGSLLGIVLGTLLGYWFNDYLNQTLADFLPVQNAEISVGFGIMMGILGFVCLVCAVTSLVPAHQATRIDTVESLQTE